VLLTKYDIGAKALALCDIMKFTMDGELQIECSLDFGVYEVKFLQNKQMLITGNEGQLCMVS